MFFYDLTRILPVPSFLPSFSGVVLMCNRYWTRTLDYYYY